MGARICPRCATRVDERRAKASPYCLSCGAPLGAPPPTFSGKPQKAGGSPLGWILGGIGVFVLLGVVGVVILIAAAGDPDPPKPAPVAAAPAVQPPLPAAATLPDGAAASAPLGAKSPATVGGAPTRVPTVTNPFPTPIPIPTPPPTVVTRDAGPAVLGAFPRSRAQSEVDRVASSVGSCKRAAGPFGIGTIRVDFEPDGRVGTITRPPFAGTVEGSCISALFRAVKIGPFQGTTQSIDKSFLIQDQSPSF